MKETDIKDRLDKIKNTISTLYDDLFDMSTCIDNLYKVYRHLGDRIDKIKVCIEKENK